MELTLELYFTETREKKFLFLDFQFELIEKWASGIQSRTSTFWKAPILLDKTVPFLEMFRPLPCFLLIQKQFLNHS